MKTDVEYEINQYGPCDKAIEFRSQFTSFKEAWVKCPRGDWMLWLAKRVGVAVQPLTLAKGLCAETVKHLMQDERSKTAVEAAIKFGKGEVDEATLKNAADVAACAADEATLKNAAAYATAAYAAAADVAAAAAAARKRNQLVTANICRAVLTHHVFKLLNILQ